MDLEELKAKEWENAGEVIIQIFKLEGDIPDGRTKEYEEWKQKVNFLYETSNKMTNFAAFKLIK